MFLVEYLTDVIDCITVDNVALIRGHGLSVE